MTSHEWNQTYTNLFSRQYLTWSWRNANHNNNLSQFLPSEQPSEPKNMDVALNIAGVEKIRSENLRLWSIWRPFDSSFERKGAVVTVKICVLCVWWFSNQFLSCDTLAETVPWNGLEHSHRKSRLCVYFIWCFDVSHSRHQSVCQQLFWDWEKLSL